MKINFNEGGHIFTFYFNSNVGNMNSRRRRLLRIWFKPGWYRGGWSWEFMRWWG